MSGIDNIIEKIKSQTENEIDEILKKANFDAEKIINDAKENAEAITKKILENAEISAQNEKNRIISMADSQSRKLKLSEKQALINSCFSMAQNKLLNMPKDEYIDLLKKLILSQISTGKEEIILGPSDQKKIGAELIDLINSNKEGFSLTLSKSCLHKDGGFIIKDGDIEYNNTFETLLSGCKEQLVREVASCLFG